MSIRTWLRERSRKNQQFRRDVEAMRVVDARGLATLSDEELIATAQGFPPPKNLMEMGRRLKAATRELTKETVRARKWAAWGTLVLIVLTVVLVALTVVLATKS